MIGIGLILIVIGGIVLGYGTNVNNDMETQLNSFFSSGKTNTGDGFVIFGIILLILGIILIIGGIMKKTFDSYKNQDNGVSFKENNFDSQKDSVIKITPTNSLLTITINNTLSDRFEFKSEGHCQNNDINVAVTTLINTLVKYISNLNTSKYSNSIDYENGGVSITVLYLSKYNKKEFINGIKGIIDGLVLYESNHPDQLQIIEVDPQSNNNIEWQTKF